tara:strand:- start:623 stop:1000 length:378 start_codon:yes stop_codon:yes gene_type:complete
VTDYHIPELTKDLIVYYRKDPTWLAMSPMAPPDIESPDALVEVHREQTAWMDSRLGVPTGTARLLEGIWSKMQNIDGEDLPARLGVRSMMVGDVIVIGERGWMVQATGWSEIHIDKELWGCTSTS